MKYLSKIHRVTQISIDEFDIKIIIGKNTSKVHAPYTYTGKVCWPDTKSTEVFGIFINETQVLSEVARVISDRYSYWPEAELSRLKRRLKLDMIL
jgi:hypothetical protein